MTIFDVIRFAPKLFYTQNSLNQSVSSVVSAAAFKVEAIQPTVGLLPESILV